MSIKLEELINTSMKGCISNQKEIGEIVNQFVATTLSEMDNCSTNDYKKGYEDLLPSVGCSNERIGELNYLDMIALIENMYDTRYFDDYDQEDGDFPLAFRCFQIACLNIMLRDAVSLPQVQMFLSLNVKAYYEYLESFYKDRLALIVYRRLKYNSQAYLKFNPDETTSIGDLTKKISEALDTPWKPWKMSISRYEKNMARCHEILRDLLVVSFKIIFQEQLNIKNIMKKYDK